MPEIASGTGFSRKKRWRTGWRAFSASVLGGIFRGRRGISSAVSASTADSAVVAGQAVRVRLDLPAGRSPPPARPRRRGARHLPVGRQVVAAIQTFGELLHGHLLGNLLIFPAARRLRKRSAPAMASTRNLPPDRPKTSLAKAPTRFAGGLFSRGFPGAAPIGGQESNFLSLFVTDTETGGLRCPSGVTTTHREREESKHGSSYRFPRKACEACPLLGRCMKNSPRGQYGRKVRKNDYEPEYRRARQKVGTAAYQKTRAEHPLIERKLGEMLNRHGGRRAHYWGTAKILIQELMAALATNVRQIVHSFLRTTEPQLPRLTRPFQHSRIAHVGRFAFPQPLRGATR